MMKSSPFILLCSAGLFAIFSSSASKSPVLPIFASHLGADPSVVGVVSAVSSLTGILASIPAGMFSDRFGRRRMLLLSSFVFATAPFLYLLVSSLWQLALIRFYHGLATAIFIPVSLALVAEFFKKERGEKIGLFSSSTLVGRFIAPITGGAIIGYFAANPVAGFQSVYLLCGVTGALAFIFILKLPSDYEVNYSAQDWSGTVAAFKAALSHKGILVTAAAEASILFAYGTFETFLPLYALEAGLSAYEVGIFLSSQIITLALTRPLMGRLSDRHGRVPQIFLGILIGAGCIATTAFFKSFLPLLLISVFFGLSLSIVTSATSAFIADLSRKESLGSSMGILGSIMDIGHTTGPILSGFTAAYLGLGASFLLAAFVLLIAASVFIVSARRNRLGLPLYGK